MIVEYLSVGQVLALHDEQIRRYGGGTGLRDRGGLEAAVARPAMTFGGDDLYPDLAAKCAALMHSLVLNHPFIDGNKRVALHAALVLADLNGAELLADVDEVIDLTLRAADGKVEVEALAIWFRQRLRTTE